MAGRNLQPTELPGVSMEFHVILPTAQPPLARIETALRAVDPAAIIDLDPSGHVLRIAAAVGAVDVRVAMAMAGCPVSDGQIEPQPSVCCGGCSG
jgi:hypothetical protein